MSTLDYNYQNSICFVFNNYLNLSIPPRFNETVALINTRKQQSEAFWWLQYNDVIIQLSYYSFSYILSICFSVYYQFVLKHKEFSHLRETEHYTNSVCASNNGEPVYVVAQFYSNWLSFILAYLNLACEQQTHFRRERSDDWKCVCCSQANLDLSLPLQEMLNRW